jgi:glycosyltransferase involved in cell wall biosynthesis
VNRTSIAIVHEWFDTVAGSEKVLEQFLLLFPQADLFVLVDFLAESERLLLHGRHPHVSFIQRMPGARRHFRNYLPLMPWAIRQFDLSQYDVVISNSHAFAKGVRTRANQTHICYCHTPMRYAWDLQEQYLRAAGMDRGPKSWLIRALLHSLRAWDRRTAPGVDTFLTNSSYIAARIRTTYGRDATVVHPPVDTAYFTPGEERREDWYVTVSRLVPYKRVDLIVGAFSAMPEKQLVVIGDGPQLEWCRRIAGPNVSFRGHAAAGELKDALRRARAFVFAAEEDFGIAPVEAQACGTPVICYGRGGVQDSVIPDVTGVLFDAQTTESLCEAVHRFERMTWDGNAIRANAERFAIIRFQERLRALLSLHVSGYSASTGMQV